MDAAIVVGNFGSRDHLADVLPLAEVYLVVNHIKDTSTHVSLILITSRTLLHGVEVSLITCEDSLAPLPLNLTLCALCLVNVVSKQFYSRSSSDDLDSARYMPFHPHSVSQRLRHLLIMYGDTRTAGCLCTSHLCKQVWSCVWALTSYEVGVPKLQLCHYSLVVRGTRVTHAYLSHCTISDALVSRRSRVWSWLWVESKPFG